jgi:hypothetical protein
MHAIVSLPGVRTENSEEALYLAGLLRLRSLLQYTVVSQFTEDVRKARKRVTGVFGAVWVDISWRTESRRIQAW